MAKRDAKRLKAIRQLPCCNCGKGGSQAAHSNFSEHGKGRGIKADDSQTIPLCHSCHGRFDKYQMGMTREQSFDWFNKKKKFIDEVLSVQDDTPVF